MSNLTDILNKSNCLSKSQLFNYLQQKLERDEEYLVESHLNDCELCNTALEGLMHSDIEVAEQSLNDMKTVFEQKLILLNTTETIQKTDKKITPTNHPFKTELKPIAGKKLNYRWAYAASILLVVGLGYSVFSFIQKYNKKEVTQDINTKVSSAETPYSKVPEDSNNELTHIQVNPEDINQLDLKSIEKTTIESKTSEKSIATTNSKRENIPNPTSTFKPPIVNKINDVTQEEISRAKDMVETRAANAAENNQQIEPQSGMENYAKEEVDKRPVKTNLSEKTSSVGLKKKNSPTNYSPSTNQMNYPAQKNSNNEYDNISSSNLQEKEQEKLSQTSEKSDLATAISSFNKGNYKKSIRQLERILPTSKGSEREDIIYYLALANEKIGHTNQAEKYYAQLSTSLKYKKQAKEVIEKMKK